MNLLTSNAAPLRHRDEAKGSDKFLCSKINQICCRKRKKAGNGVTHNSGGSAAWLRHRPHNVRDVEAKNVSWFTKQKLTQEVVLFEKRATEKLSGDETRDYLITSTEGRIYEFLIIRNCSEAKESDEFAPTEKENFKPLNPGAQQLKLAYLPHSSSVCTSRSLVTVASRSSGEALRLAAFALRGALGV